MKEEDKHGLAALSKENKDEGARSLLMGFLTGSRKEKRKGEKGEEKGL